MFESAAIDLKTSETLISHSVGNRLIQCRVCPSSGQFWQCVAKANPVLRRRVGLFR